MATWLRPLYEYLSLYCCFAVFGAGGLLFTVASAVLYPLLPRAFGARLGQAAMMYLFRFFVGLMRATGLIKFDLDALDALKREPSIIVAPNHPSLIDAVLVISRLPTVVCIMKAEIWDNIFLGGGSRLAGYIRNDSPVNMVRLSASELRAGRQLLVFPEGTRTRRKPINRFKGGFALIAKKAQAPVQTVIIETNSPFLGKGWPLFKKPQFPIVYRARLGKRFAAEPEVKEFVAELERYYSRELGADGLRKA
jgi:1-acyl-sn-glycerol-3-phosphate acyltransferase